MGVSAREGSTIAPSGTTASPSLASPPTQAKINLVDTRGQTALHVACKHGQSAVVRALMEMPGIDANAMTKRNASSAATARGASPPHDGGLSPLMLAATHGHAAAAAALLGAPAHGGNAGRSVDADRAPTAAPGSGGRASVQCAAARTALMRACEAGHAGIVEVSGRAHLIEGHSTSRSKGVIEVGGVGSRTHRSARARCGRRASLSSIT